MLMREWIFFVERARKFGRMKREFKTEYWDAKGRRKNYVDAEENFNPIFEDAET